MKIFHKAVGDIPHEEFLEWIKENPQGSFINRRTSNDMILHKASCYQVASAQPGDITASVLICSVDRRELENWVAEQGPITLKLCNSCWP
jgi:hypothetical protein